MVAQRSTLQAQRLRARIKMRFQRERGAALVELQLSMAATFFGILVVTWFFFAIRSSISLGFAAQEAADSAASAARAHYKREVETTRCVAAVAPSLATLIAQNFLPADKVLGHTFSVNFNYEYSATRPVRVQVFVSFPAANQATQATYFSAPTARPNPTTLMFDYALNDVLDPSVWDDFNYGTRCIR